MSNVSTDYIYVNTVPKPHELMLILPYHTTSCIYVKVRY